MNYDEIYDEALNKYQQKDYDASIKLLNAILQEDESHHHSWHLLGHIFFDLNDLQSAKEFFLVAINKKIDFFDAYYMLGNVLFKAELFEDAVNIWIEGSQFNPYFALNFANIAIAYDRLDKKELAILYAQKAVSLDKNCFEAIFCLAKIYQSRKDIVHTKMYLEKVLELQPNNVLAHFDLSYVDLSLQEYASGFAHFEYRKKMENRVHEYNYLPFKPYHGEPLNDKHLLLYHEQGFGDNIQFIRFIQNLQCKELSIGIQNPLNKLFAYNFPEVKFLDVITDTMPIDCMDALMSVPFITHINQISNQPYLSVDENDVSVFKQTHMQPKKLNIGLVWKGSTANQKQDIKSLQLSELDSLLHNEHCSFYSLQIEHLEELAHTSIHNIGKEFKNFYDTAVALKSLDLFIGVDTAVSHLAGALGVKTFLIYNSDTIDFRWCSKDGKSLWYESVEVVSKEEIDKLIQKVNDLIKDIN
jgi:tetratricopeptide (TPR) repeat protein